MFRSIGTRMRVACIVVCVWPALSTAQTIRPQFGWKAGSTAEVTTVTEVTTTGLPAPMPNRVQRMVQTLSVLPDSRGLIIHDVGRSFSGPPELGAAPGLEQLVARLESRYLVNRSGAYLFALDTSAAVGRTDSVMRSVREMVAASGAGVTASGSAMITSLTSPTAEVIDDQYRRQWPTLMGPVSDRSWTRGDTAISSILMGVPMDPGRQVAVAKVLRFDGEVRCPAADSAGSPTDRTCWQFSSALRFPADYMQKAIENSRKDLESRLPPEMVAQFADLLPVPQQSITQTMVYEPSTLVPLRIVNTTEVISKSNLMNLRIATVTTRNFRWSGTP